MFFLAAATSTYANSDGAPKSSCDDMFPRHNVDEQSSEMPYEIVISKTEISPGDTVNITIGKDKSFKGFMIQVRDGDKAVGQFIIPNNDEFSKTLGCHRGKAVSRIFDIIYIAFSKKNYLLSYLINLFKLSTSSQKRKILDILNCFA